MWNVGLVGVGVVEREKASDKDPDQMPHTAASDMDQLCFLKHLHKLVKMN